jgi:hypothetical protein
VHKIFVSAAAALLLGVAMPVFAAGMDMQTDGPKAASANVDYSFELAAPPKSEAAGKSIVSIKLLHGGKPVTGAIIIQSRADMGPIGMASMAAPIKSLGEQPAGTYRFEVDNGSVWKKPDNWALSFGAKVQGVAQTVSGNVTVKLVP